MLPWQSAMIPPPHCRDSTQQMFGHFKMGDEMISDQYGHAYQLPGPFHSLDHVRKVHRERGGHYFDADTSRFFRARYSDRVYAGALWIDSVRGPGMPREYRVKILGDDCAVNTLHDDELDRIAEYDSLRDAQAAVRRILKREGVAAAQVSGPPYDAAFWGWLDA